MPRQSDGIPWLSGRFASVLEALNVPWTTGPPSSAIGGRPGNGARATICVEMDAALDGRLEMLVDALSGMRWSYTPGRSLQLVLPGLAPSAARGQAPDVKHPGGGARGLGESWPS